MLARSTASAISKSVAAEDGMRTGNSTYGTALLIQQMPMRSMIGSADGV